MNNSAATAISAIYQRDGAVTASAVLAEAEDESSPLHGYFQWDDTKAARAYRFVQARTLIRTVRIVHEGKGQRLMHVPVIVAGGSREGTYKPVYEIVKVQSDFQRARAQAQKTLDAASRALDELIAAASSEGFEDTPKLEVAREALRVASVAMQSIH